MSQPLKLVAAYKCRICGSLRYGNPHIVDGATARKICLTRIIINDDGYAVPIPMHHVRN